MKTNNAQLGFSLIEVLITLLVSTIALLALAGAQLKTLQFATNSFMYTASIIHGNNAIERVWSKICELQDGRQAVDTTFLDTLKPANSAYTITYNGLAVGAFNTDFTVEVTWLDERMTDGLDNKVSLNAAYPTLEAGCNG
ncbi:prepilin-type N-terminal cleavage/methylation domain-containing protein [Psychrobium sp. 1_MG-2023]|uniref:type IV pilus modification PilV family protein n=1 Tax=Psychrobium sp. 1_MG-2023 TaxID=3062624 RepID=UPI000C3302AF|nr:prepilin-type N-terminal cleavage/methylation domain-containing protein [Psychrobium sp. 1_MG-2023]MDP2560266.1 prepilin-type N-terminal cleavage/methylation domain-containing protein [Psychrobium sp. 1_MG-2023]PKF55383.1 prepilin-type cleavage/methylation domain-containing protein [Alteromonadales bacterium alter-6D02]